MSDVRPKPSSVILMGVSGSGKSTVGKRLAEHLGWIFRDGDEFHPRANVEKMRAGIALTDDDRWPWLRQIADALDDARRSDEHLVVACSALKRSYRNVLTGGNGDIKIVYLRGDRDLIERRMAARKDHYMPPSLLDSQYAALEEPDADEHALVVSVDAPTEAIVEDVMAKL